MLSNVIVSMHKLPRHAALRRDDRGATAVEYGLLVALIAAVIVVIVTTLGTKISTAFATTVSDALSVTPGDSGAALSLTVVTGTTAARPPLSTHCSSR